MRSTMLGLLILDSEPDWERLVDRYERASRQVPILRQKIVEGPVPWANPRLIVDPDFDLSFHLRRFRVASKAGWAEVLDECRRQSMTDFDRDRPLWKVTVLEGLPGGKAAVITKLHHAVADGQGPFNWARRSSISVRRGSTSAQCLGRPEGSTSRRSPSPN